MVKLLKQVAVLEGLMENIKKMFFDNRNSNSNNDSNRLCHVTEEYNRA